MTIFGFIEIRVGKWYFFARTVRSKFHLSKNPVRKKDSTVSIAEKGFDPTNGHDYGNDDFIDM